MQIIIRTIDGYAYRFEGKEVKLLENNSQLIVREKNGTETIFIKRNVIYASREVDEGELFKTNCIYKEEKEEKEYSNGIQKVVF